MRAYSLERKIVRAPKKGTDNADVEAKAAGEAIQVEDENEKATIPSGEPVLAGQTEARGRVSGSSRSSRGTAVGGAAAAGDGENETLAG